MMELQNIPLLLFFNLSFLILLTGQIRVQGSTHLHHRQRPSEKHEIYGFRPTKLFVFGDSYADTGNNRKSVASSWKEPYGITFPGKPAGRYSDGRVFTDYLAKFLGIKSPVPYRWMKYGGKRLRNGVNFAYGGTGVFDTIYPEPNMTAQIDFFQKLLTQRFYTQRDLRSSLFLLSLAGNDYGTFVARGGTPQGFPTFIPLVVNQLAVNLKRLRALGAKRVAVTALEPLGCLPQSTVMSSFQQCNSVQNEAVSFHNLLLNQAVAKLNNETKDSAFVILDLYSSFTRVLQRKGDPQGNLKFETPLKPCCMGINSSYSCGNVDGNGTKMYAVCNDPKSAFFWDQVHPTEAGWHAVYADLKTTLEQNF